MTRAHKSIQVKQCHIGQWYFNPPRNLCAQDFQPTSGTLYGIWFFGGDFFCGG